MQLWVSKLNKNKWKITLIILSVALVTSCIFGFTAAWFNHVDSAKANVGMDVKYVDILANGSNDDYDLIPAKYYQPERIPKVLVGETEGTYCVFLQIKKAGGCIVGNTDTDPNYIDFKVNSSWEPMDEATIQSYDFSVGKNDEWLSYYYQIIDAAEVQQVGGELTVFDPIGNDDNQTNACFQANPKLTLEQVEAAIDKNVTLSVVAAGCKTALPAGSTDLPTEEEVAFAEVYTAFF